MTTIKAAMDHLKEYKPTKHVAVAIWLPEDVLARAKERDLKISLKQANEILDRIDENQEATLGISWDAIDCYLDDL